MRGGSGRAAGGQVARRPGVMGGFLMPGRPYNGVGLRMTGRTRLMGDFQLSRRSRGSTLLGLTD